MALKGRKQKPEHVAKRVAAVAATKALWSLERKAEIAIKASVSNRAGESAIRAKNSAAHKGKPSPSKGKKYPQFSGENHWNYGNKMPQESIEKMRAALKGKKQSAETIAKRVAGRNGYRHSLETRKKIRQTNIDTWAKPDIRDKTTGANSPSWQGGKSFEPYPTRWTFALREAVRNRDGRQCRNCGKVEIDNGKRLSVHHVDGNKRNLLEHNLISLCVACHGRVHGGTLKLVCFTITG